MQRKCKICGADIKIQVIRIGAEGSKKSFTYSEGGVYFPYHNNGGAGTWFCNPCWRSILGIKK